MEQRDRWYEKPAPPVSLFQVWSGFDPSKLFLGSVSSHMLYWEALDHL